MKDISVILTVYNQPLSEISFSLSSIVSQKEVDFEVVVADDGSKIDMSNEIISFFEGIGFHDYKIVRLEKNAKTVANVLNGAQAASGKYLKVLGTGDLLYDEFVLRDIVRFSDEEGVEIGFGKLLRFALDCENVILMDFNAPRNRNEYRLGIPHDNHKLLANQLLTADWIPGGLQFGKYDVMLKLWKKLRDAYDVLYCEDFAASCALAESVNVAFMDRFLMWYDFGDGISTSGDSGSVKRLYNDHRNFYRNIANDNVFDDRFVLARLLFRLREAVALHTPLYSLFQAKLSENYAGKGVALTKNEMLERCIPYKLQEF